MVFRSHFRYSIRTWTGRGSNEWSDFITLTSIGTCWILLGIGMDSHCQLITFNGFIFVWKLSCTLYLKAILSQPIAFIPSKNRESQWPFRHFIWFIFSRSSYWANEASKQLLCFPLPIKGIQDGEATVQKNCASLKWMSTYCLSYFSRRSCIAIFPCFTYLLYVVCFMLSTILLYIFSNFFGTYL